MKLDEVSKLLKDFEAEKMEKKDILSFIDKSEREIYDNKTLSSQKRKKILETFTFIRKYIGDKGASHKMLLEMIALSCSSKQ